MSAIETLVFHNAAAHHGLLSLLRRCRAEAWEATLPPRRVADAVRVAVTMLRAHHGFEDEILLPRLRRDGAIGPWDELEADHHRLADALVALEQAEAGSPSMVGALERLIPELEAHAAREEAALTEAFWRATVTEEQAKGIGREVMAHQRAHLKPAAKLLPALLYNLEPDEQARFTEKMPAFVKKALIPVMFRPAWRGLRPFLAHPPRRWLPRIRVRR